MNQYLSLGSEWVALRSKPILEITDEELENLRFEEGRINQLNDIEYHRRVAVVEQFKIDSKTFFRERFVSRAGKARQKIVDNLSPERPAVSCVYGNLYNSRAAAIEEKQRKEREQTRAQEESAYLAKCIRYLVVNGVEENDVSFQNPVSSAEAMESERLIKEAIERGGFINFTGDQDCESGCRGWDGESHRCDCCHRRVSWTYSGGVGDMYVYGEAH